MLKILIAVVLAIGLGIGAAYGHGGGLDKSGGHHNRKAGTYHCHRAPCFARQKAQAERKARKRLPKSK